MTEKNKDRDSTNRQQLSDASAKLPNTGFSAKEYNYIFHITDDDIACLEQHRGLLATGSVRFSEIYYNYLFDNPDIADVLYAYERNGGETSEFIRSELAVMLDLFSTRGLKGREQQLVDRGRRHLENGIKPVWVAGAYRLFLDFLRELVGELGLQRRDRGRLGSALLKLVIRDMGLINEGYWGYLLETAGKEFAHTTEQYSRAERLLAGLPQLLWSVDIAENRMLYANYPLQTLYSGALEVPYPFLEDVHEEDQESLLTTWQEAVNGHQATIETRMSLAGAPEHWYRLSLYPTLNHRGRTSEVHCMLEDINVEHDERTQLEQLSTTDSLTGLPNRTLWADHLNMALAASRRVPGSQVAVISLDINHFKMYNDTLGRQVGDSLLRDIAKRLQSVVRESDSLARLGGDQFGILLQPESNAKMAAERVITQILDSFDIPFSCGDKQLSVSLTIGVTCFPDHGTNEEALLMNAETAMYRAKRNSLPYQFFNPVSDVSPAEQLRYSGQIKGALENNEFELFYQPQVDLKTSGIIGAEALLRWQHPTEGTVLPQRIIPVAEQLGMISPITDWVLRTALQQCRQWNSSGKSLPVSINVSARSFQSPRLVDKIEQALQNAGISGEYLEIEITEATLMLDLERAKAVLDRLATFGVTVAIDDFGTGYSSLSYLKKLPVHTLKIDQSFIMDVAFDKQDIAIVRSIIDLGHNLGYRVVAEGVEHSMAWNMLNNLGCDAAQGFHISRPLSEDHFSSWMSDASCSG
ncbi:MAG: EAL domain-containing protein [Gammaproteobacteria bacterium]|nr:MAG: EAL domain-containing protein [Gammaproteobacteria bacterium]